jgi:two-component system phosphate regulon sensor histidine kinase PhoR
MWGDVVAQVTRIHRRKTFHKQRTIQIFRELRRSTAAMPDGVIVLNADNEIIWFNRMAGQLLGLRRKVDYGLRIDNLLRQPEFARYLNGREFASTVVVRAGRSLESYLALQIVPYGADQKLLLARDVTRESRLEAMRRDFVANASHELRSPLTVMTGYLETLAGDPQLAPDVAAPMQEMRRQAERMTAIVQDLLELSRLEASDSEVDGDDVDVPALLAVLRKDVLARNPHPAVVDVKIETTEGLRGDAGQLHSAFWNLIDNAAKYTPPEGSMFVRWWADAAGAHLSVIDTGPGIASEHLPRLTERFYRIDSGRSRASGGSGLGLAIVKHVLQRHGGQLEVSSVEGQGSSFICHFPRSRLRPVQSSTM